MPADAPARPLVDLSEDAAVARFLAPLIDGKRVGTIGGKQLGRLTPGALTVTSLQHRPGSGAAFDVIVAAKLSALPACQAALQPGGVLVLVEPLPSRALVSLGAYHLHVIVRPVHGSIAVDARFAHARAVRLADAGDSFAGAAHVQIWSDRPLPDLPLGLGIGATGPAETRHLPPATQPARAAIRAAGRAPDVALAGRLMAMEERLLDLLAEKFRLTEQLAAAQSSGGGGAAFDVPRTRHGWPLLEEPGRNPSSLGLYDHRPDDPALPEARAGDVFFATYGLEGPAPDYAGAVAALNTMQRHLTLSDTPDMSIVIPVYGQLPYTLNVVQSLFNHRSRYTAEIIVVDDCSPDRLTDVFLQQIADIRSHRQAVNGGFIESCNTGGAMARGRYVLMLNSDTRVVEGWLDAMLDSFAAFPRAGLVGSKMLYPDGTLQEAGGIIWRDGSAWNYGRHDDPNRPQYCYARQVDYISGCSIALPTQLWHQLGGFDAHFTPAYAEDADLCQRVTQAGYEVWYQPLSRVVHYEGKTSGTSTAAGAKAYQVINLKKLFMRWRSLFETHRRNGQNPFLERERGVLKRILLVDSVTPTPDQDAGSLQTMLAFRCCLLAGYKPSFVPEDNWLFVPGYTPAMQAMGVDCSYAPFETGFENYIRRYGWLFDVVLTYRVHVMTRCMPLIRAYAPQAVVIFHVADLHYLRMERQAALEQSVAGLVAARALKERELGAIREADCTITHSTAEAEILAGEVPAAPVVVWPLMVEFAGTSIGFDQRRDICFLGGYRHPPNVDAVEYFVRQVFPLVRAILPGIRFLIAGANPTQEVEQLAAADVIVTGMIPDLRDVFDQCRVFVCPLRVGAGVKGKVVSALSHGIPVVSTSIGVEGAGLVQGEHALVADTPEDMAAEIVRVYCDQMLWERLSVAGQAIARAQFSIDMGRRQLDDAVSKAYVQKLGLMDA